MIKQRYFYFSIGPVQEFVGKARRLRDYWTGSFLLSYLTEQAMDEVNKNHGTIVFPPYEGMDGNKEAGSSPNRFQANVPIKFSPDACVERIQKAWKEIADHVWESYVKEAAHLGRDTRGIWNRQVESFWNIQWVLADEEDDALLDKRKNWRSYIPSVEPGDKCTLFGNLQEISGYISSIGRKEGKSQRQFWDGMRLQLETLNLKEGERLSAIALIKRLFPRAYNELKGTDAPENFPSTTYMSSVPWLRFVMEKDKPVARVFAKEAKKLNMPASESRTNIQCLTELVGGNKDLNRFISLDGNCFHKDTVLNDGSWDKNTGPTRDEREALAEALEHVNKKVESKADSYYALLAMDGDKMGAILQENKDKKPRISKAISDFSKTVPSIITRYNGKVVYAGGEDVFAILPISTAVDASIELKNKYMGLFKPIFPSGEIATISAAIIFAHHHAPLNRIYNKLQTLLDNTAKKEYGRSTLAICTWNTGGPDLVWAMPWKHLTDCVEGNLISRLAKAFADKKGAEGISNSFVYNMRKRFGLLSQDVSSLEGLDILTLLKAEYIKSRAKSDVELTTEEIEPLMKDLLKMCTIYYRDENSVIKEQRGLNFDGALLVKFLARRWYR